MQKHGWKQGEDVTHMPLVHIMLNIENRRPSFLENKILHSLYFFLVQINIVQKYHVNIKNHNGISYQSFIICI